MLVRCVQAGLRDNECQNKKCSGGEEIERGSTPPRANQATSPATGAFPMKRCAFVLVCVVLLSPGRAEPPGPAEKPVKAPAAAGEKWTIDDIVNTESAHGFQF